MPNPKFALWEIVWHPVIGGGRLSQFSGAHNTARMKPFMGAEATVDKQALKSTREQWDEMREQLRRGVFVQAAKIAEMMLRPVEEKTAGDEAMKTAEEISEQCAGGLIETSSVLHFVAALRS